MMGLGMCSTWMVPTAPPTSRRYRGSSTTSGLTSRHAWSQAYPCHISPLHTSRSSDRLQTCRAKPNARTQTRAVLISLNLYSGNYDVICLMTFIIEFTHGGSVVPSFKQRILATDIFHSEYYQGWNLATSLPEILVYVCILAYVVHFLYRMGRTKRVTGALRNHFRDKWNLVEVVWFALMMSAIAMRLSYFLDPFRLDFDIRVTDYQELANLAFLYQLQFIIDAMTVLMFAIKSIKFFALQKARRCLERQHWPRPTAALARRINSLPCVFLRARLTVVNACGRTSTCSRARWRRPSVTCKSLWCSC